MDPSFFNNATFNNMSPEKMQFLLSFAQKDKPKNMKDIMPFLLSNMKQAKDQHLDFSKPEVQLIANFYPKIYPLQNKSGIKKLMNLLMG